MTKSGNWRCSSFSLIQRITRFQLHLVTAIARVRSLSYSREIHKFNFSWRSACPVQGWLDMRFWPRPGDAWCSKCRGKNAACKDCFSTFSVFSFIVVHIVVSSSSLFLPKFMARESQTRGGGGGVGGKFPPYFAGKSRTSVNFLVELACLVRLRSWEQKKDCLIIA